MMQKTRWLGEKFAPGLVLGLFIGRILSEQWSGSWQFALVVTFLTVSIGVIILRRWQLWQTWPFLLLAGYVFYPEPNPYVAGLTAVFTLILLIYNLRLTIGDWRFLFIVRCLLFVGFFLLYILTLAPDILPADSGEFQVVAAQLGVAHPPGFPLYTVLGHLMTQLPWGISPAYKLNLFSAVTSTFTLIMVYGSVHQLTQKHLGGVTAVLALGSSTTFWSQATTTNIRSLTGLFAAVALYTLVRWGKQQKPQGTPSTPTNSYKFLSIFAFVFSLGMTHHASLLFMGLVWLIFILLTDNTLWKKPRQWIRPFLAGLLGLLPLLYLPLRATANVRGASPDLATWSGFLDHVLARGFSGDFFYFTEPTLLWERLKVMGHVLTFQFSPWLLLGMGGGFIFLSWEKWKLALLLGGSFAVHTFITATYRAPQTVEYMLPAYISAVLCLGYGIDRVLEWKSNRVAGVGRVLFAAGMLVSAVFQGIQHYPSYAFLHRDRAARDYAQSLLEQAPSESVILADWHWATPLWYLQEVEGLRTDVTVRFVFPEGELYAETWVRRIQEELGNGRSVIATHFDENSYTPLPPPEPIGEAFLFRQTPRSEILTTFTPTNLSLQNVQLLGYQLIPAQVEIGQEAVFTLAWQPISGLQSPIPFFAHLVSPDGLIYAQQDLTVTPQAAGITLTQFRLTPRPGVVPGKFSIMVGAGDGERTPLATLAVTAMTLPPVTYHPVYRTVVSERPFLRLIGYDWDTTLPNQNRLYLHWQTGQGYQTEVQDNVTAESLNLPVYFGPWGVVSDHWSVISNQSASHYVPLGQGIVWTGSANFPSSISNLQSIDWWQNFTSSRPLTRDLVISVRLIGYETDGFHWQWTDQDDSVPAMGAIPTLKWIAGSQIQSPHFLVVDEKAYVGQTIGGTLRLYDAFTNRPLPILDERITNQFPWVPLGQTTLP